MKILVVAFDYPPPPGGIQTLTRNLKEGLEAHGHDVRLLHLNPSSVDLGLEDFIPDPRWIHGVRAFRPRGYPYSNNVYRRTSAEIDVFEPDIVHVMHVRNWPAIEAAKSHDVPSILSTYALELGDEEQAHRAASSANAVHAISDFTRSLVHHVLRGEGTNVYVAPPSIEVEGYSFTPRRDSGPVVSVARFVDRKNLETVVEAWKGLSAEEKGGRQLIIVGDGPKRREVDRLAAGADDVEVRGWVSEGEKADLLSDADLFALVPRAEAYDVEGFGIVYIEAQASGTPVVGSAHGGAPEAIGEAGLVIEDESDPDVVAEAIRRLLTDEEEWERCVEKARARMGEFSIGAVAKKHLSVYEELAGRASRD